jgi:nucleotide-binding universal stress UspA family protein
MGGVVVGRRQHQPADAALEFAATEARLHGGQLTLAHVWDLDIDLTVDTTLTSSGPVATAHASPGPIETTLFEHHPDLLVLSRDADARHLSRLLHTLLRHASCPLAVVPSRPGGTIARIVVGVCGTSASEAALRWAAREAELHGAQLNIVRVWQLHPTAVHDVLAPAAARARAQARIESILTDWVRHVDPSIDASITAIPGGPLDQLLEAAADADLLVTGLMRHHGIDRLWHGRLAEDLSLLAACPTVVVPPPIAAVTPPTPH